LSRAKHLQQKAIKNFVNGIGTYIEKGVRYINIDGKKCRYEKDKNNRWKLKIIE
jgi:hypothetical protein